MGQASAGPGVNAVTANGIDSLASDAAANGVEHTDLKNRWLIAASAVGIHISIGSVYAWSVFNLPLENAFGWAKSDVAITFSLAIFFLGGWTLLGRAALEDALAGRAE